MLVDRMHRSGLVAVAVLFLAASCGRTERREERSTTRETTTRETIAQEQTRTRDETIPPPAPTREEAITTEGATTTTRRETTRVTRTSGGRTVTEETTTTTRTSTGGLDPGYLRLELDESDCVEGGLSMDVEVVLQRGAETSRHRFNASCGFTERETFTLGGLSCTAESGMCSRFMGRGRMRVACSEDHGLPVRAEDGFPCPED